MSRKRVAVIEGDDASPEAVKPTVALLDNMKLGIEWVYPPVGVPGESLHNSIFPDEARELIDRSDTTLFGAASGKSAFALIYLRWGKQTYANVRPTKWMAGCRTPLASPEGVDFVIVRENLEDMYLMVEGALDSLAPADLVSPILQKKVAELGSGKYALKVITEAGTERVARFAFELARRRKAAGRPGRVTVASKYNMLPQSDGLFKDVTAQAAQSYTDVEFETMIVDNFAHFMIRSPQELDVVLLPNLYGDILSDAAAGLAGGLGLAPSGAYGDDYAYFEAVHGTAPDLAGRNVINPTATLLSAAMMLDYLGFEDEAKRIETAMAAVYREGRFLTPDQGGRASTSDFVKAVEGKM
jgi:isocitrate/isopropylmalate dehydrogenase